jgi:hypothetical protein
MAVRSARLAALVLVPIAATTLLTGCSQSKKQAPISSPTGSTSVATSKSATASKASTAPARASVAPSFNGQCDDLLPVLVVDQALGRPVIGSTSFVRGIAEPNIGRLTYLNCRYGLPKAVKGKPAPVAQVEIGVSLYRSAAQAAARVQGTIEDYRSHGASQQVAAVGNDSATILIGNGSPTLVVAEGPRTVAITVDARLISAAPTSSLTALAKAALAATSNFAGVAGVTATPSPTGTDAASGSVSPSDGGSSSDGASPSDSPS